MSETNTKKRTERGSFDEGISPEHKVTRVMASPSAEVESPATLEVDEPSLGDIFTKYLLKSKAQSNSC